MNLADRRVSKLGANLFTIILLYLLVRFCGQNKLAPQKRDNTEH